MATSTAENVAVYMLPNVCGFDGFLVGFVDAKPKGDSILFHLWCHSPFWALTSLRKRLHSSLSSARLFHPLIPRICEVSLRRTSSHLILGFHTGILLQNFSLRNFCDAVILHSCEATRSSHSSNFSIIQDI
jgi:hypothetical protein